MTEELNCDKHRMVDQDPEDDCSSTESPKIVSSNELEDSEASIGACCNPVMKTTSPDIPDVARSITPTPCLKPGMTRSKIRHEVHTIIYGFLACLSCFS